MNDKNARNLTNIKTQCSNDDGHTYTTDHEQCEFNLLETRYVDPATECSFKMNRQNDFIIVLFPRNSFA